MFRMPYRNFLVFYSFLFLITLASCNQTPGYTILGQLSDTNGNPMAAKEIVLGRFINFTGQFHSFSVPYEAGNPHSSITDEEGKFQIFAERTGFYLLLYESEIDEVGINALTDKNGNVVTIELSETKGANVGTVFVSKYPNLPKQYLPDFLDTVSIGMTFEDFESQHNNLIRSHFTDDHNFFELADVETGVSKVVYGFDVITNQLEILEISYSDENAAFTFGETIFGIPNYQSPSSNGKSVINWYFNYGNGQIAVEANGSSLIYQVLN